MSVLSLDEYYKKNMDVLTPQMNSQITAIKEEAANKTNATKALYEGQIAELGQQYDDLERQNAVQKLINEREVAENMANLGLTDSGLNRTQQTAVQLSASNNTAKNQRQKQSMVASLTRETNSYLAEIEGSRISSEASLRKSYEDAAWNSAQTQRQADIDAETERIRIATEAETERLKEAAKAAAEAEENRLLYNWLYEDKDAGKMYFRDSNDEIIPVQKGVNPYTGDNNTLYGSGKGGSIDKGTDAQRAAYTYGVFSNGYQPKGIIGYGAVKKIDSVNITGKPQNIWYTDSRRGADYWIWDGSSNQYLPVKKVNGQWVVQ